MDDEVKGDGNSVNYNYRMHDPRLGRFFAIDPLAAKYPYNSTYAFSENVVINAVELEGKERNYVFNSAYLSTKALTAIKTMNYDELKEYMDNLVGTLFSSQESLEYAKKMLGEKFEESPGYNSNGTTPLSYGNRAVKGTYESNKTAFDYFYVRLVIDNGDGTWSVKDIKVINNAQRIQNLDKKIKICDDNINLYKESIKSLEKSIEIIQQNDLKPSNDDFRIHEGNGHTGVDFESISYKLGQLIHIEFLNSKITELKIELKNAEDQKNKLLKKRSKMSNNKVVVTS